LGSGIYVLAGAVITKYTGPSIILSFIFAGLITFFSGIGWLFEFLENVKYAYFYSLVI